MLNYKLKKIVYVNNIRIYLFFYAYLNKYIMYNFDCIWNQLCPLLINPLFKFP